MKRTALALMGVIIVSAATMSARQNSGSTSSDAAAKAAGAPAVTYEGCLVAGETAGSFALVNATEKGKKDKVSLKIVAANAKVGLGQQLTHAVEVTGTVESKPTGGVTSDLPTLSVTKIKFKSDYCG